MTNINTDSGQEPDSFMWKSRALAIAYGRVPAHRRGDRVWVWFCDRWVQAVITRNILGGCYMARLDRPIGGVTLLTVAATTYGGLVE